MKTMNTQRDIKIAEAIGWKIYKNHEGKWYVVTKTTDELLDFTKPHQLQMIEDWVVEQGCEIFYHYQPNLVNWDVTFYSLKLLIEIKKWNKSKPLAFLHAVEELIDNQKK